MFCHITQTWRGKPLISRLAVVDLIAATTTKTGLTVQCELDENSYAKGIKVTDAEMATLNIESDPWHPEWNYGSSLFGVGRNVLTRPVADRVSRRAGRL
jgi:hypothetical protein